MKYVCILPLLFIFCTHITIWALARSHSHGDREVSCRVSLNHGERGVMEGFNANSEANKRTKGSIRSFMEEQKGSEVEDEDANSESDDYGRSDPPPVPKRPTKKPVQYRIFSRPPAPSPRP